MGLNCQISIDKPKEDFHRGGQVVTGLVKYIVDKPKQYKDVVLSFVGYSRCCWQTHGGKSELHVGREQIVSRQVSICDKKTKELVILQGVYEYPFKFPLPENIPRTYKDKIGSVCYEVVVTFEKVGTFKSDKTFEAVVPVRSYVSPCTEDPAVFHLKKTLLAPFRGRKSIIHLKAQISKTCLSPGENINLNYMVVNDSDVVITCVRTCLYCYTIYTTADNEKRTEVEKMKSCKVETPRISERSACDFICVLPTLPDLYSVQHSRVISKEYRVRVTVKLPIPHLNASLEIPILIGDQKTTIH